MAMLDLPGSHELPKDRALQNYGFETRNLYDSAKNPDTTNISRFRSGYIIGHQFDYNDTAQQDNAFFECNDVDKITFCAVA